MARVTTALIACGALAREVLALRERHGWGAEVLGVPSLLHNRPDRIPAAVLARIREAREKYDDVIVVYGALETRLMELMQEDQTLRPPSPLRSASRISDLNGQGVPHAIGSDSSGVTVSDGAVLLPPSFEGRGAGGVRSKP